MSFLRRFDRIRSIRQNRTPAHSQRLRFEPLEDRRLLAVVTDESSLRSAISGTDVTIEFNLSSTNTISLSSALTAIIHQVKINGYNQTGGSRVELQWTGGTSTTVEGLVLDTGSGGSTIEGLAIGH